MKRWLFALAVGLILSACGPNTSDTGGGGASPAASPAASPTASPTVGAASPAGTAATPNLSESPMAATGEGGYATPAPMAAGSGEAVGADNPAKVVFPETERVQVRPLTGEGGMDDQLSQTLGQLPEADRGKPAFLAETAEGTPLGVAYSTTITMDDQPADVVVGMGMDGTIRRVVVQNAANEAVAGSAFLDQFMGKSVQDLEDEGLVRPAEGAEAESREILAAVRRAALILDHGILDPSKQTAETHGVQQE